jgi:hypothetical protein
VSVLFEERHRRRKKSIRIRRMKDDRAMFALFFSLLSSSLSFEKEKKN